MRYIDGIPIWGEHEEKTIEQIRRTASDDRVYAAALMADGHLGYAMPIGGVVAYKDAVSPNGVGFDISCGNKAARTDVKAEDIAGSMDKIMDEIFTKVTFGLGRKSGLNRNHEVFDDPRWKVLRDVIGDSWAFENKFKEWRSQLGSVGSGNHYVDVFADEEGMVWIGVHFGSRGVGHTICTGFMNLAHNEPFLGKARNESMEEAPTVLDLLAPVGDDYWTCMELAGSFAYAGRDIVVQQVADILGASITEEVHNHHNFAWKERHNGEDVVVVRKGATPAFPGQRGFIGGSMADSAVIVSGAMPADPKLEALLFEAEIPSGRAADADYDQMRASLFSTIHGAGRIMSRRRAAGKWRFKRDPETGAKRRVLVEPGEVSIDSMLEWVEKAGVELRGGGADESPHVYRRLYQVLQAHSQTINVEHALKPMGVAMAGADVFDPYKD